MSTNDERILTKRERKALRRSEKEQGTKRSTSRKKITTLGVLILVVGVAAILLYAGYTFTTSKKSSNGGDDPSVGVPIMESRNHISPGSPRPAYNSNPPTSGPHYAQTAERGVHTEELPDETLVHNLEHGEVWISYRPDISQAAVKELEDITRANKKVVLTIRSANEKDIAFSAWGRLDSFDVSSEGTIARARIENFIERYRNKGPEAIL